MNTWTTKICRICQTAKKREELQTWREASRYGVCVPCYKRIVELKRKEANEIQRLERVLGHCKSIMLQAIKDIQHRLSNYKFPLEHQVIFNIMVNALNMVEIASRSPLYNLDENTKPVVKPLKLYQEGVIYPIILYALIKNKGNQVHTKNALGISRNTLRDMIFAMEKNYPALIDEMGAKDILPKKLPVERLLMGRGIIAEALRTPSDLDKDITSIDYEDLENTDEEALL